MLRGIGFAQTADRIQNDPSILVEGNFNPIKTWIEYVNRLVGVIIGLLIVAVFVFSLPFLKNRPAVFSVAALTLVLVVFQGWFGSIVVSTNLTAWTISVHLFLAVVIVLLLTWLVHATSPAGNTLKGGRFRPVVLVAMGLLLIQTFLGTEVRAVIDRIAATVVRAEWIGALGTEFVMHRLFSWVLLVVNIFLAWNLLKTNPGNRLVQVVIALILGSFLTGAGMMYGGVPAFLQPVHLLVAVGAVSAQYLVWLRLNPANA